MEGDNISYVSLSEKNVFEYFCRQEKFQTRKLQFGESEKAVSKFYGIERNNTWISFFKKTWTIYLRLRTKRRNKSIQCTGDLGTGFSYPSAIWKGFRNTRTGQPRRGNKLQKKRNFIDLSDKMKKERTNELISILNNYVRVESPELSTTQLLGFDF